MIWLRHSPDYKQMLSGSENYSSKKIWWPCKAVGVRLPLPLQNVTELIYHDYCLDGNDDETGN